MSEQRSHQRERARGGAERDRHPPQSGVAIRGGAVRVLGYAAGVLVSLAAAAVIVRHLGVPGFGRYVTATSLVALVGGVTEAGIVVYGIRAWGAQSPEERPALIANLLGLRLALALGGVVCATVFALVAGYGHVLVLATLIAGAGLLAQVAADVASVALQAELLLARLTAVELARRAAMLLLVVALALLGAGLLPFVAATSVAALVAAAAMLAAVRGLVGVRVRADIAAWRALFAETLPYAVALSLAAVYLYVTVIVMSLVASATQTGLFATSFRVTQAALAVPALLLTAVFPLLARSGEEGETSELRDALGKILTVALLFGVWMSLATALGADFVVRVIAGVHGDRAAPVLRIQGLIFLVSFVSTSSALGLVTLRRYRPLIAITAGALALNVALGLALVPPLGAQGGAIADVATEALAAIALTGALLRSLPGQRVSLRLAPAALLACGLAALVLLAPIGSLGRALVASAIYFAVLALTGALPDEVTGSVVPARLRPGRTRRPT
ncbi:MAG TPA: oligosaccharide flippase family protein [Solirubrobacteraceae bacterium]|nr:oligosaccharide flippase family protein [Solirubrobacteraceae bacterium]